MKEFEDRLSEYVDRTPEFSRMSQIEQIKYMAFFHTKAGGSIFNPMDILASFELCQLRKPSRTNFYVVFNRLVKKGIFIPSYPKGVKGGVKPRRG